MDTKSIRTVLFVVLALASSGVVTAQQTLAPDAAAAAAPTTCAPLSGAYAVQLQGGEGIPDKDFVIQGRIEVDAKGALTGSVVFARPNDKQNLQLTGSASVNKAVPGLCSGTIVFTNKVISNDSPFTLDYIQTKAGEVLLIATNTIAISTFPRVATGHASPTY